MFEIEKVYERDIDLYIINKFLNDPNFKNIFINAVGYNNCELLKCIHSFSNENGESDITIILSAEKEKIGLLIEDKIGAIAMPDQYERYKLRGNKLVEDGIIDNYYIFIIAPSIYLSSNSEAKKYDYQISYENILDIIKDDEYGVELIRTAINEKKKGYSPIVNDRVTLFWNNYYKYIENNYPNLDIKTEERGRGSKSKWPIFNTPIKSLKIVHKSEQKCVDLELPGLAEKYYEINKLLGEYLKENNMLISYAGKSLAIRIKVDYIDFNDDFSNYVDEVDKALKAVEKLYQLVFAFDFNKIIK